MKEEYDYRIALVTDITFPAEVLQSTQPVLVDFYSPGCAPCQGYEMTLVELKEKLWGKVKVVKYNVNQNAHYSRQYGVRPTPTSIVFRDGKPIAEHVGSSALDYIVKFVRDALPDIAL